MKAQLTLALSASTRTASVALLSGSDTFSLENPIPRKHSEFLNSALAELLKKSGAEISDIGAVRLDRGPGSFTGERAAVSFAKTLAYSFKIPILATTSLEVLLAQSPEPALAILDAHRNLFYAQFSQDPPLQPQLLSLTSLDVLIGEHPDSSLFHVAADCGDALRAGLSASSQRRINFGANQICYPKAETLLRSDRLNFEKFDWNSLFPLYIRLSSAEEVLHERSRNT
jgi:tRNA threonylcarbamoyl adenosine modification protein YeaZ